MKGYWIFELPLGKASTDQEFKQEVESYHVWDYVTTGKLFALYTHQFPHLLSGVQF